MNTTVCEKLLFVSLNVGEDRKTYWIMVVISIECKEPSIECIFRYFLGRGDNGFDTIHEMFVLFAFG